MLSYIAAFEGTFESLFCQGEMMFSNLINSHPVTDVKIVKNVAQLGFATGQ